MKKSVNYTIRIKEEDHGTIEAARRVKTSKGKDTSLPSMLLKGAEIVLQQASK